MSSSLTDCIAWNASIYYQHRADYYDDYNENIL